MAHGIAPPGEATATRAIYERPRYLELGIVIRTANTGAGLEQIAGSRSQG